MDIRTQFSPQPWLIKASLVLVALAIPATVLAQNKFFGTTTRGVEGGKGNAQIKMLMDENALRRNETTQNAGKIDGLETRMGTAEGAITTLEGTVSGHTTTLSDHATRIGTLETATADVEDHAKTAMPAMCHEINAKLRWNTTTSVWECLPEGDPTVQPFAKTTLPTCTASQLLRSNGSGFTCVNAGSNYVITETDPKVGATTSDQWCRGTGSQVTCDQVAPTGNDPRIGTLTTGKWCTSNGSEINCSSDAPSGGGVPNCAEGDTLVSVGAGWDCSSSVHTCSSPGQVAGGGVCVSAGPNALIAATSDAPTGSNYPWGTSDGSVTMRGTTSTTDGAANTSVLASYGSTNGVLTHPAASYCASLITGGFSDWYLPAKDELNQLYQTKDLIGGFSTAAYWSSTENHAESAWNLRFSDGWLFGNGKTGWSLVRCVRRDN